MHTLNELAIFRARLLREHRQPGGALAEASISQLDETIISRPATNPDEGIAKLELARDLAAATGKTTIVQHIEGALLVLRHLVARAGASHAQGSHTRTGAARAGERKS